MKNLYKNNENEMNRHLKFVYMSYNRSSLKWKENESGGQKSSIVRHLQIPLKTHFLCVPLPLTITVILESVLM